MKQLNHSGQATVSYVLTIAVMALGLGSIFMSPQIRQGLALLYTDAASRVIGGGASGSTAQIATWGTDEVEVEVSDSAPKEPKTDAGPIMPTTLPPGAQPSQPTNTTQVPESADLPPGIIIENPSAASPEAGGATDPTAGVITEQGSTTVTVDAVPSMSQEQSMSSSLTGASESATCQGV